MDIYIGNFSPHYISPVPDYIKYPAFETVIKRILSLSGMPVLCHPCSYYGFDDDDVIRLVNDFRKACGGTGAIEVYYQNYTEEQQKFLQGLPIMVVILFIKKCYRHWNRQKNNGNSNMIKVY